MNFVLRIGSEGRAYKGVMLMISTYGETPMNTFGKTTLIALAAAAAALTAAAAPMNASADPAWGRGHDRGDWNHRDDRAQMQLRQRIDTLDSRIDMGRRTGDLSGREARRLSRELNNISWQVRDAERSGRGLSPAEYASLSARLDRLSMQVRENRHDGNRW